MSKELKAFVDRFEGDFAVLLIGEEGHQLLWPIKNLPDNTCEGNILNIVVQIDIEATKAAEDTIENLIDRLNNGM